MNDLTRKPTNEQFEWLKQNGYVVLSQEQFKAALTTVASEMLKIMGHHDLAQQLQKRLEQEARSK